MVEYRANLCKQYCILTQRAFRNLVRVPIAGFVKIIMALMISAMIILIFQRLDDDLKSV